jgi:hypothetical protein
LRNRLVLYGIVCYGQQFPMGEQGGTGSWPASPVPRGCYPVLGARGAQAAGIRGDPDWEARGLGEKLQKLEVRWSGYIDLAAGAAMSLIVVTGRLSRAASVGLR